MEVVVHRDGALRGRFREVIVRFGLVRMRSQAIYYFTNQVLGGELGRSDELSSDSLLSFLGKGEGEGQGSWIALPPGSSITMSFEPRWTIVLGDGSCLRDEIWGRLKHLGWMAMNRLQGLDLAF